MDQVWEGRWSSDSSQRGPFLPERFKVDVPRNSSLVFFTQCLTIKAIHAYYTKIRKFTQGEKNISTKITITTNSSFLFMCAHTHTCVTFKMNSVIPEVRLCQAHLSMSPNVFLTTLFKWLHRIPLCGCASHLLNYSPVIDNHIILIFLQLSLKTKMSNITRVNSCM